MGFEQGLNKATLGRTYEMPAVTVDAASIRAYAKATSDENPRYLDPGSPGGQVAPPLYSVRLLKEVLFKPFLDPEVNCDLLMLLHGEQDMRFHELIRPGDRIATACEIAQMLDKESGQVMVLKMSCRREQTLVSEAWATMFIRPRKPASKKREDRPEAAPPPAWDFEDSLRVTDDQPRRYAEASLDNNPIHIDEKTARAAGLRGPILQGLCTMAFAQRTVVNRLGAGHPARLRRLKVRFSKPVYPGDQLTVQGRRTEEKPGLDIHALRIVNAEGAEVISAGVAEVSR